jgi:hypothetical protein
VPRTTLATRSIKDRHRGVTPRRPPSEATEEQIIGILREQEAAMSTTDLCR